jgi:hypothetical protein
MAHRSTKANRKTNILKYKAVIEAHEADGKIGDVEGKFLKSKPWIVTVSLFLKTFPGERFLRSDKAGAFFTKPTQAEIERNILTKGVLKRLKRQNIEVFFNLRGQHA